MRQKVLKSLRWVFGLINRIKGVFEDNIGFGVYTL